MSDGYEAAWSHVAAFKFKSRTGYSAPACLYDLGLLEAVLDEAREILVRDMRDEGCTWAEVGDALGTSKQAAMQRYRRRGVA